MNLERELKVAIWLALEAGAALRCHQPQIEAKHKAYGELVTAADIQADSIIQAGLKAAYPDDAIFSEESADSPARLSKDRVWIIDPLDSTSNFVEQGNEYVVSIGLSLSHRATLGVVYNPNRDELFAGYQGAGVMLNGASAQVSDARDLFSARLSVSRKEWLKGFAQLPPADSVVTLSSMAYKLARVAAGLDDGVWSMKLRKEWGTCAGVALVLAAGGRATLLDGTEIKFNRSVLRQPMGMVAAGAELHAALLPWFGCAPSIEQEVAVS
jgi:myo-inositol-1(or 4)-monophosphatase